MDTFQDIYYRFLAALRVNTDDEVADALGIPVEEVHKAQERQSIPLLWYCEAYKEYAINPAWLENGDGFLLMHDFDSDGTEFEDIYERICYATKTQTQIALADVLNIRQSSISDARRHNAIPEEWYVLLRRKLNINPYWLKNGSGPMFLSSVTSEPHPAPKSFLAPEEKP